MAPHLRLLAAPALLTGSAQTLPLPPNDALLLAMLALDGALGRDAAASLLWPDNPPASARANLRQRVKRLQDATGGKLLVAVGPQLALAPGVQHDLADLPGALQAHPQAASGALLGPLQIQDNPAASDWLDQARARVHALRQHALQARAEALEHAQQLQAALPYAQRLVAEDPLQEHAHRRLMRLHYQRGDRGAALAAYRHMAATLQQHLGSRPDAQTEALARLIEGAEPLSPMAPPVLASPSTPGAPRAPSAPAAATWAALMRPPRLLQRQPEWAQLSRAWAQGGVVLVLGEGGIGKSRLLHDFADSVGLPLRLQARPGDTAVPYALLARWVNALLPQAQSQPDWARAELARLAPALGQPAEGPMSPLRLSQALAPLTEALGAVLLDDLHLADAASLELLPTLLQPLRCSLLASRTAELPAALQPWLQQAGHAVAQLHLAPWQQGTVQELLQGAAVPAADSAAWAPVLWRHTGGHPLLVLETLRTVLLEQPEGSALGAPPDTLPMPPQVMQLVRQRLAGLPALAQQVAQVASLAGDAFGPELCSASLLLPLNALDTPWQTLQDAGLMNTQGGLHDLVLEAARGTLSAPAAMALHAAIGTHLTACGAAPARLAVHWAAAGKPALAAACHEAAAQAAAKLSRGIEQVAHWAHAANCWRQAGDAERAFKATAEEAERLITGGEVANGLARAQGLVALAEHPHAKALAHRLHALALIYSSHYEQGLHEATLSHAAAKVAGDTDAMANAVVLRSWAAAALNQRALTEECLTEEQSLPLDPTDWRRAISRKSVACMALQRIGLVQEALAQNEQCIEWADRPEARSEQMVLIGNSAAFLNTLARHRQGHERARQALDLARTLGEDSAMTGVNARMHVGLLACSLGRYGEAIAELERCQADLTTLLLPRLLATTQNHLAWLWAVLGQSQRALQLLDSGADVLTPVHRLRRWTLRAEMQRLCGTHPPGPPSDHETCADANVKVQADLVLARGLPPEPRLKRLQELSQRCAERSMVGQSMLAQVLQLQPLASLMPASATHLANRLYEQLQECTPNTCYWPEAMWEVHLALKTNGQPAQAQQALADAWAWIERAHATQVPDTFKDGFLHRNLINVAIQRAWRFSQAQ